MNTWTIAGITVIWAAWMAWRFYRNDPGRAAMITLISGWIVLPVALFDPVYMAETNQLEIGVALPGVVLHTSFWWTKASALGITLAVLTAVFARNIIGTYRWSWWDLPLVLWCCAPLFHFVAAPEAPPGPAAAQTAYLWLSWGVVYAAGRLWLGTSRRLVEWYRLWVLTTLILLPFCLMEMVMGPKLYEGIYGLHPYQWCGAVRYVGFRPMLLFEHGNQLGIWLAGGAVLAVGLWKSDTTGRVGPIPLWAAAVILCAATVLAQSLGAILLLPPVVAMLWVANRRIGQLALTGLALLLSAYIGLRLIGAIRFESLVAAWPFASETQEFFENIGRRSFGYRLIREEEHASRMMEHWAVGGGSWNWWRVEDGGSGRPWGLWPMAMGMYGLAGLIPMLLIFAAPIVLAFRRIIYATRPAARPETQAVALLGCAFLTLHFLDSFLNSVVILPVIATAGGLVSVVRQRSAPSATMKASHSDRYTASQHVDEE